MEQTSFMKKLLTIFSQMYMKKIEELKLDVVSQPTVDVEKN